MKKTLSFHRVLPLCIFLLATSAAHAAGFYWNGVSGNWTDVSNWSTTADGLTPPAAVPLATASDALTFSSDPALSNNSTLYLNGTKGNSTVVATMTFNATGTTALLGGVSGTPANQTLYISTLTVNPGAGAVTIGDTAGSSTAKVDLKSGSITFTNNSTSQLTLANGLSSYGSSLTTTFTFAGSGNTRVGGVVANGTGTNVVALTKNGAGTLTLAGANTYTSTTTINAGKIALGNALALQNSAFNTTGSTGGVGLDVTGFATPTLGGLSGSVDLATAVTAGYGSITTLTLNPQSGSPTYSGVIANGAAGMKLVKSGAGTQILSGNNSYTGTTTITGGTLTVASPGVLNNTNATGGSVTISGAATFRVDGGIANCTSINGTTSGLQVGTTTSGNVVVTNNGTLNVNTGRLVIGGSAAGSGTSSFSQDSGATTVASNFYTANYNASDVTISGGNFTVNGSSILSQRANTNFNVTGSANVAFNANVTLGGQPATYTSAINLSGGTVSAPTVTLGAGNSTNSVTATINLDGGTLAVNNIANSANGTTTVNLNGGTLKARQTNAAFLAVDNAYVKVGNATIDDGGFSVSIAQNLLTHPSSTGGGLTKLGAGTLTLNGTNTYTGGTTITAGTLVVGGGGTINSSASIALSAGAALTNDTATALTPGLSLGEGSTLSGAAGAFTPSAITIVADLSDGFTPVTAGSALTKAGSLTFTLSGVVPGTFPLFTGSPTASFTSVSVGVSPLAFDIGDSLWKGSAGGFDYAYSDSLNTLSVVPESGTWILVGIGLTFLLHRKPRRRLDP